MLGLQNLSLQHCPGAVPCPAGAFSSRRHEDDPIAIEGIRPASGSKTGKRGMTFYIAFWLLCAVLAANIVVVLIALGSAFREERRNVLRRPNYARRCKVAPTGADG